MVIPKQLRKVSLDMVVGWLYMDLRNPDKSWAWKNRTAKAELNRLRADDPSIPGPFSTIATHVNDLRALLHISPPPGRRDKFG